MKTQSLKKLGLNLWRARRATGIEARGKVATIRHAIRCHMAENMKQAATGKGNAARRKIESRLDHLRLLDGYIIGGRFYLWRD